MFAPVLGGYLVHTMGVADGFRYGVIISLALAPFSTILLVKFLREKNIQLPETEHVPPFQQDAAKLGPTAQIAFHAKGFWSNLVLLPRALVPLLAAYFIIVVANSTTSPYMIFYGMTIAKLDSFQWGAILSLQLLFANIVRTPLGILSDKFDKKKVLFVSVISTAPLSVILVLEHSFLGILGILLAMIATGVIYGPTHEALQIELTPRERRPALFAIYDVLRTASTSVGTLVGGVLFTINYALPFYGFTALEVCAGAIIACAFFHKPGKYSTIVASK